MIPLLWLLQVAAPAHDVQHYDVAIALPDTGNRIEVVVSIRWVVGSSAPFRVDLDTSLVVSGASIAEAPASWRREGRQIVLTHRAAAGDTLTARIAYAGHVTDGLVLRGQGDERTIFADNWPNRARTWLASVDHPSDKATVTWHVRAPLGLTVVATGVLLRADSSARDATWHFRMAQPTPVHTMVIGAAHLSTTMLHPAQCDLRCVPVSVVAYPRDSAFAVDGPFRNATEIIDYFRGLFGPFPYATLRHVQSSTVFGGMENSTAIFYDEAGYQRRTMGEGVVAHETAHQWFGDAVSQASWSHLWLSEGFATYGAALWTERRYGRDSLAATMRRAAARVMGSEVRRRPIVDSTPALMDLLNPNNYQKGSWVLHSLRGMVGDSAFFQGLRTYVQTNWQGNALSEDFARVMSAVSGRNLTWYFQQALEQPGYPVFSVAQEQHGDRLIVTLTQVQDPAWGTYRLPGFTVEVNGTRQMVDVTGPVTTLEVPGSGGGAARVVLDPEGWWLLEVR